VPEPSTHYQLSFTVRQAMALFVGLLLALGAAYFLGLMTGLAGREGGKTAAAAAVTPAPTPEPTAPERIAQAPAVPTPIRPLRTARIPAFPKPVLGREPTVAPSIQFFEDRAETEPTASPRPTASRSATPRPKVSTAPPTAASGEFWVQVTSVASEREARARRDKLIRRGYRARVLPGQGPKGTVYRVRVGPYSSREEASKASDRLSREEKVKTWIVPAGK
jgi:DedD protein